MTNQEINLKIAKIEGYALSSGCCCFLIYRQLGAVTVTKNGKPCCVDYINDWNLLGPLVVKLLNKKWFLDTSANNDYQWCKLDGCNVIGQIFIEDKDFGKATCLAYIKEFGDE